MPILGPSSKMQEFREDFRKEQIKTVQHRKSATYAREITTQRLNIIDSRLGGIESRLSALEQSELIPA